MMSKKIIPAIIFILLSLVCISQTRDSLVLSKDTLTLSSSSSVLSVQNDSTLTPAKMGFIKRIFKKDYPNPKKALWLGLALPGMGQFYNKQYWKMPIVYGGYTGLMFLIISNGRLHAKYRAAYIAVLDEDDTTIPPPDLVNLQASDIKKFRDAARKQYELSFVYALIFHFLQAGEAYIFSHLSTFDIDEDLSLQVAPKFNLTPGFSSFGIGLTFRNKAPTPEHPISF